MPYNLADLLAERAHERPSSLAVECGNDTVTYHELYVMARERAAHLIDCGVAPGDRVALHLPRSVEAAAAFFGVQFAGAVAVFIAESLRRRQVEHVVRHSQARVVLTTR